MPRLSGYYLLPAYIVFLTSCLTPRVINKEYVLHDVVVRNLFLVLNKDSTYQLVNRKEGNLFFSSGRWRRIDRHTILLINPYCIEHKCDTANHAIRPGEKINYDLMREFGSAYLFPAIAIDTGRFNSNYKDLMVKGFKFTR
jgi:hypothetical protein